MKYAVYNKAKHEKGIIQIFCSGTKEDVLAWIDFQNNRTKQNVLILPMS